MQNFPEGQKAAAIANHEFDRLVGSAHKFLPKSQVEGDIAALLQAAKPIKDLRNDRVAHLAENPSEQLPTYEHLDEAIIKLVELLQKYSLLIKGVSRDVFPEIQDDWQAIFRVPWIAGHSRLRR